MLPDPSETGSPRHPVPEYHSQLHRAYPSITLVNSFNQATYESDSEKIKKYLTFGTARCNIIIGREMAEMRARFSAVQSKQWPVRKEGKGNEKGVLMRASTVAMRARKLEK